MAPSIPGWNTSDPTSLSARFFEDDGLWKEAPLLTGHTRFEPLPDVRNILVTGGEGFIGSWLVRHLVLQYPHAYNIISFDKLDYCSSRHNSRMLSSRPNFKFIHGNLLNDADLLKCLVDCQIDTVFHLAAHTHVDLSFGNSYDFTVNNVIGTHKLLQCIKQVGSVKRFFHVSTDEVYGEVEKDGEDLVEHSLLAPTNPYAASKAAAEMMVTAYVKSWGLPTTIVRLNNVYGPHQYPEKIIPKFINLITANLPLLIHGDGQHTRRYLHAGDAASAFDTILHRGELGQIYNVDSRDELPNLTLAAKLLRNFGLEPNADWIKHTADRPFNDRRYAVDGSKLRALGWEQRVGFEEGLAGTVEWYRRFKGWWGDVSGVLTAFPVVRGDHVEKGVEREGEAVEVKKTEEAVVGAAQLQGKIKEVKSVASSNGHGGLAGQQKKRKATAMEED
ncbi:hypothetical protein MBLNU230_g3827t1 [Neophaeotheca triangularis]